MANKLTALIWKFTGSTFVLIVLMLVVADYAISLSDPLKKLQDTGFTSLKQYFVVSKLPDFLSSHANPDIIVTGSSLMLYPAVRCDDMLAGRATRYDGEYTSRVIDTYTAMHYLETLVQQKSGRRYTIENLATAGGLISDQFFVLRKCLRSGIKPKLVVCDISPREFLDNNQSDPKKTPVYIVLSDFTCLNDLLKSNAGFEPLVQGFLGNIWSFYRNRSDWKFFFTQMAAAFTGHPADMFAATQLKTKTSQATPVSKTKSVADYNPKPNTFIDLFAYKKMYLPVNSATYELQLQYLNQLLSLAQENDLKILLVDMPLTKQNLQLLPQTFLDTYESRINTLSSKYNAPLITPSMFADFDNQNDFEDSAHLTCSGGKKLFAILSEAIKQNL